MAIKRALVSLAVMAAGLLHSTDAFSAAPLGAAALRPAARSCAPLQLRMAQSTGPPDDALRRVNTDGVKDFIRRRQGSARPPQAPLNPPVRMPSTSTARGAQRML